MRTRLRMYLIAGVVLLALLLCGAAASAAVSPSFDLDQCRNGPATAPVDCKYYGGNNGWVNANAGDSQSHFVEGMSIPYRGRMTNLPTGQDITVILGYDITHGGPHAIDYLTQYERLEPHQPDYGHPAEKVYPKDGVTGVSSTFSTFTIPAPSHGTPPCESPVDDQPTTSYQKVKTNEGEPKVQMTLFGGTISDIHYVEPQGCLQNANAETQISITFRADSPTAVLAWGGHIASAVEWGPGKSVGGTSGSPYHMKFESWSLAQGGGSQDRSLSGGAVKLSRDGAAQALIKILGNPDTETLYISDSPVNANTPVYQWGKERKYTSPNSETYLFVWDPTPTANWEHVVYYYFVYHDGTIAGPYKAYTLPDNVKVSYYAGIVPPRGGASGLMVSRTGTNSLGSTGGGGVSSLGVATTATCDTSQLNCDNCWALLVSGGYNAGNNNARYYEDMSSMYKTLISPPYCYLRDHIYVLMSDGTNTAVDQITDTGGTINSDPTFGLSSDMKPVNYLPATRTQLDSTLGSLKGALGSNDQLFIFTTNHGGLDPAGTGKVRLWLWNTEFIWAPDFVSELLPNNAKAIVTTMEQCNSGGFVDQVIPPGYTGSQKRVIATAASSTGASYLNYFSKCWIKGVVGDANNPPSGDSDKLIELWETYDYAKRCDAAAPSLENPQYKTTSSDGQTLSLSSCSRCADPKALAGYGPPTDPDQDGIYEDLNGAGGFTMADVVLYFNQMDTISSSEPICAFDTNGNGRIDLADVVNLFKEGRF